MCNRQGVTRPKGIRALVRGRVNATHVYVPTVRQLHQLRKLELVGFVHQEQISNKSQI